MAVEGTGLHTASTYQTGTTQAGAVSQNEQMSMESFWQLIAAELQYQDPTNPMSNGEMMEQMTQMNSMNTMEDLSDAVSNFATVTNNLSQVTLTQYSTSMLGREVTVAVMDEQGNMTGQVTGTVEGIDLTGGQYIYIDGEAYALSQIMAVGKVPQEDSAGSAQDIVQES